LTVPAEVRIDLFKAAGLPSIEKFLNSMSPEQRAHFMMKVAARRNHSQARAAIHSPIAIVARVSASTAARRSQAATRFSKSRRRPFFNSARGLPDRTHQMKIFPLDDVIQREIQRRIFAPMQAPTVAVAQRRWAPLLGFGIST
jgi:hypothetical protein